jgi:hypothetical protein
VSTRTRTLKVLALVFGLVGCELGIQQPEDDGGAGSISGTVTNAETNQNVGSATISLRGAEEHNVVSAVGIYAFDRLIPGSYTVTIVPPQGYEVAPNTIGTVPVQIVGSETKTVNFRVRRLP